MSQLPLLCLRPQLLQPLIRRTKPYSFALASQNFSSTAIAMTSKQVPGSSQDVPPVTSKIAEGGETDHGIALEGHRKELVEGVIDLFCSKPTVSFLQKFWREDAVFEDPIAIATGFAQFSAQWFGMPKAFPESVTLAWKVTKNEPNLIVYEQRQKYTIALIKTVKIMESVVIIELDEQEKIKRLEDRWDGKALPTGGLAKTFRGLNGRTLPHLIGVPKEDKK